MNSPQFIPDFASSSFQVIKWETDNLGSIVKWEKSYVKMSFYEWFRSTFSRKSLGLFQYPGQISAQNMHCNRDYWYVLLMYPTFYNITIERKLTSLTVAKAKSRAMANFGFIQYLFNHFCCCVCCYKCSS